MRHSHCLGIPSPSLPTVGYNVTRTLRHAIIHGCQSRLCSAFDCITLLLVQSICDQIHSLSHIRCCVRKCLDSLESINKDYHCPNRVSSKGAVYKIWCNYHMESRDHSSCNLRRSMRPDPTRARPDQEKFHATENGDWREKSTGFAYMLLASCYCA
jgi:hypothetical protein